MYRLDEDVFETAEPNKSEAQERALGKIEWAQALFGDKPLYLRLTLRSGKRREIDKNKRNMQLGCDDLHRPIVEQFEPSPQHLVPPNNGVDCPLAELGI
jgi:hypothetical protein